MLTKEEVTALRDGLRDDILLVIDAAYAEYVTRNDYTAGIELVDAGENVVMTRTFSKIYALGAVRLGWAYCPAVIADVLNRIRPPFNVTSAAQAAGIAAIGDVEFLTRSRDHNTAWLPWLAERLEECGLDVIPSFGNFVLARFPEDGVHDAASAMAFFASRGIIPRSTASAGIPDGIRITVGIEDEMRAVIDAVSAFMDQK
jgi:histidinol-phosphate aminotransferase